jgi:hypothetical protein
MVNLNLLDAALARIDADPDSWNQGAWRCETGMCLAGHVAHAAGAAWATTYDVEVGFLTVTPDGGKTTEPVSWFAAEVLGLTDGQRYGLFDGYNTREGLQAMRDLLAVNPDASEEDLRAAADAALRTPDGDAMLQEASS